jgi:hypothetical protein
MVYEQFFGDQERFWGWRCIFCGEIVDEVILENRQWLRMRAVPDNKKKSAFRGKVKELISIGVAHETGQPAKGEIEISNVGKEQEWILLE